MNKLKFTQERHLELSVVMVEDDEVTFKIVEQTHRNGEFSQQNNPHTFTAANGVQLRSVVLPEWGSDTSALYCRGNDMKQDNNRLTCTTVEFAKICEAVAEYNETDGKGYEKLWPSVGDKYFCVAAEGKVDRLTFDGYEFDHRMQDFGNFFRTEEDAKAALERVKQVIKEKAKIE